MSTGITEGRWNVGEDQFAARIIVPDVKGFFLKLPIVGEVGGERQLIIEPGTRALLIDDGVVLGEATAGAFTMESLEERLQFWKGKQFTAIITRHRIAGRAGHLRRRCRKAVDHLPAHRLSDADHRVR